VVFMPSVTHAGVSRKIASEEERHRLKRILQTHRAGTTGGFIVRTAGEGVSEEEIAAEPWFSVRENDIFPEEFLQFLAFPKPALASLLEHHREIFRADFWRDVQRQIQAGEVPEVFPYRAERRLANGAPFS